MTTEQDFKTYLDESQALASRSIMDPAARDDLFHLIERNKKESEENPTYKHFYEAEKAFYQGSYELSLKYYLECKDIEDFPFFCYRASAYVSKKLGQHDKCKMFVEKALAIYPQDPYTLAAIAESPLKEIHNNNLEEDTMNTDVLPTTAPLGQTMTEGLTQKLYQVQIPDIETKKTTLKPTDDCCGKPMDVFAHHEEAFEQRIKAFQKSQGERLMSYLHDSKSKQAKADNHLFMLNGWPNKHLNQLTLGKSSSGFFIRWNNKGIAVNPGSNFMDHFHEQGLCIRDIDFVIQTNSDPDCYNAIKDIYSLNSQLNKINPELQIIHYYLCHKAYQELSMVLKPNFKQERNSLHQLEIFMDSPETEAIELTQGITLNYFGMQEIANNSLAIPLGIRLDLRNSHQTTRVGYLSGTKWNPLLSHHMGTCEVLITGFGNTCSSDYSRLKYNEDCLGYYGCYSLMEEINPTVMICTEFGGREGDIRIEAARKLRCDYHNLHPNTRQRPVVLPGDQGLKIDLKNLFVQCTLTNENMEAEETRVVRTCDNYGNLHYLSSSNCL
jgi:tetratricopeptide (TPR) repeat protein